MTTSGSRITTTTIGAYPKPTCVPITDWFTARSDERGITDYTSAYAGELEAVASDAEALFRRATEEVISDQIDAGIDVVTDGEVRRENYVHHQCRWFAGFDFENLRRHRMRGTTETLLPAIIGPVSYEASPLAEHFRIAQAMSSQPVKVTVPGPMTIADSIVDAHYLDPVAMGADLAKALHGQIRDLADAGCGHIQIDEPLMAREPERALTHGIEHLGRCFEGIDIEVVRTVHCCCGYPNRLDEPDYPKADPGAYLALADALDAAPVDQVSIEDAHRPNDLGALLPRFEHTTIVLGSIDVASSRVEDTHRVADRLEEAAGLLPPGRLVAAPDCGLGYLSRDLARTKLARLVDAVAAVNRRRGAK